MRTTIITAALVLSAGIASAAHTSAFYIENGRASLLGFAPPSAVTFRLDMAPDTDNPATGVYSIDMPAAGTMCEVWITGEFGFDMNGDGETDMGFEFDPIMVDNTFESNGFRTAWSVPYAINVGDFEIDLTPFGLGTSVMFNNVTLALLGGDTDNPAPEGELGPDAFMEFGFSADIGIEGPATMPAADIFEQAGLFNMRYNAGLGFMLIPTPAAATLLALAAFVPRRRR